MLLIKYFNKRGQRAGGCPPEDPNKLARSHSSSHAYVGKFFRDDDEGCNTLVEKIRQIKAHWQGVQRRECSNMMSIWQRVEAGICQTHVALYRNTKPIKAYRPRLAARPRTFARCSTHHCSLLPQ